MNCYYCDNEIADGSDLKSEVGSDMDLKGELLTVTGTACNTPSPWLYMKSRVERIGFSPCAVVSEAGSQTNFHFVNSQGHGNFVALFEGESVSEVEGRPLPGHIPLWTFLTPKDALLGACHAYIYTMMLANETQQPNPQMFSNAAVLPHAMQMFEVFAGSVRDSVRTATDRECLNKLVESRAGMLSAVAIFCSEGKLNESLAHERYVKEVRKVLDKKAEALKSLPLIGEVGQDVCDLLLKPDFRPSVDFKKVRKAKGMVGGLKSDFFEKIIETAEEGMTQMCFAIGTRVLELSGGGISQVDADRVTKMMDDAFDR